MEGSTTKNKNNKVEYKKLRKKKPGLIKKLEKNKPGVVELVREGKKRNTKKRSVAESMEMSEKLAVSITRFLLAKQRKGKEKFKHFCSLPLFAGVNLSSWVRKEVQNLFRCWAAICLFSLHLNITIIIPSVLNHLESN